MSNDDAFAKLNSDLSLEERRAMAAAQPQANGRISDTADVELISSMSIESLREFLQGVGYRVETVGENGSRFLRSATSGLAFDIRPGSGVGGRFGDIAFVALLAVRGTLPLDLLNRWNRTRRFGRLFLDQPVPGQEFLVFCMDVPLAGGVTAGQLRGQVEIWDSLIQQLVPWLREEVAKLAPKIDTSAAGSATQLPPSTFDRAPAEKSAS